MNIDCSEKISIPVIPECLIMPMYAQDHDAFVPLSFFFDLGTSRQDLETILGTIDAQIQNIVEISFESSVFYALPYRAASLLISSLATIPKYSIFRIIDINLIKRGIESGAINIDDFAPLIRTDSYFWELKLLSLKNKPDQEIPKFVPVHPQVDWHKPTNLNREAISLLIVDHIANPYLTKDDGIQVREHLHSMLEFHHRENEYSFFLYHILINDESTCLLAQSLFADWIEAQIQD